MSKLYLILLLCPLFTTVKGQEVSLDELTTMRLKSIGKVQEQLYLKDFKLSRTSQALFEDLDSAFFQYGDSDFSIAHVKAKNSKNNSVMVEFSDKTLYQKYESDLKSSDYVSINSGVRTDNTIAKVYQNKLTKEQVVISIVVKQSRLTSQEPKTWYRFTFQRMVRTFGPVRI